MEVMSIIYEIRAQDQENSLLFDWTVVSVCVNFGMGSLKSQETVLHRMAGLSVKTDLRLLRVANWV